jgi:hypothetical protein
MWKIPKTYAKASVFVDGIFSGSYLFTKLVAFPIAIGTRN